MTSHNARRAARRAAKHAASPIGDPTLTEILKRERIETATTEPTQERLSRARERISGGSIERDTRQSRDSKGRIVAPYRTVDTLEAMEAAGTITRDMRIAGEKFMEDFRLAHLDSLQAAQIDRVGMGIMMYGPDSGMVLGQASYAARNRVWGKIISVGGIDSDGGACLWHVLGWQQSLRQWATERTLAGKRLSPGEASGILRTVLGVLAGKKNWPS